MRNHIENIRKSVKEKGFTPTSGQIRQAINTVCPSGENILENKFAIVTLVVQACQEVNTSESNELAPVTEKLQTEEVSLPAVNISSEEKYHLVTTQANVLGFNITEHEALTIADSVDDVFKDYSEFVQTVTTAIRTYFDYKFDSIEQSLDSNTQELREHITTRTTKLNNKLANVSNDLKTDLGGIRQGIKSAQTSIIERLAIRKV
ncbi:MAG: hypothetical protein KME29_09510 [Calothrix sp. FI2-JRJ7]|jgi:subtilase family serine protease|nr:hypothetical protein [Calothrix sp. FI2-JRJ7]